MRKLYSFLLALVFPIAIQAQEPENALEQLTIDTTAISIQKSEIPVRKLKTGVDVGMGYMFSSAGYGGPQFYFRPHLTYPVTDRFWITAGIQAGYNQFMVQNFSAEGSNYKMLPMTQMFLYASGNYKVSEKLILTGTAYKQVFSESGFERRSKINSYINNGMSVGFNYKIGANLSIGAQININNNNYNPYSAGGLYPTAGYYNPYVW